MKAEDLIREVAVKATEMAQLIDSRPEQPDMHAAIRLQAETRDTLDRFTLVKSALETRHAWLSQQVVPKLMEEKDVTKITLEGVGRVHLQDDVYVTIEKDKREAAHEWFSDHGFGDLISKTINGSTLAAWVRRRLKSGDELPDNVKVTPYTKAVITRA